MKHSLRKFLWLSLILQISLGAYAQQEAFIHGEIELRNQNVYRGKITWSAGQTMWVDLLVVEKKDNPVLQYLDSNELKKLREEEQMKRTDWGFMTLWKNQYPARKLTLRCRFGDIQAIQVTGSKEALIQLKNGAKIRSYINGDLEYTDQLGAPIRIHTESGEKIDLEWGKIAEIRFKSSPTTLPQFDAVPLYGIIQTRFGTEYTGMVTWDMYEHLNSHYLDGRTIDNRRTRYPFHQVKSIKPKNEGSLVQLQSRKEIYLHEFTNVTNKNEGIMVRHPEWGQVNLRWGEFKNAEFLSFPAGETFSYDKFVSPKALHGTVQTKDQQTFTGALVYDLDENWDIETLDGWDEGGGLRQVPFRAIDKIYPVSQSHAAVFLKDGKKLILGDRSDVDQNNWGIMVRLSKGQFQYIPWEKVQVIQFDQ